MKHHSVSPQWTTGFHSTILKELEGNDDIRETVRVNKFVMNLQRKDGNYESNHLTKSGDLEMTC